MKKRQRKKALNKYVASFGLGRFRRAKIVTEPLPGYAYVESPMLEPEDHGIDAWDCAARENA